MPEVVFDSSFLIAVAEHPTTWAEDMKLGLGAFEPVLLDCVAEEMRNLAARGGRKSRLASLALELASSFRRAESGRADVDSEISSFAETNGAAVATIDTELQARLRARGIRVVSLRRNRVSLA